MAKKLVKTKPAAKKAKVAAKPKTKVERKKAAKGTDHTGPRKK